MDLKRGIEYALDGKAMIFYGAGFSRMAINLNDLPMGDAKEFSHKLCGLLEIKESDNLSKVSDYFIEEKSEFELIKLLHDEFTCKRLYTDKNPAARECYLTIADINWIGIYTTNYDDVLENANVQIGKKAVSVTLSDKPRDYKYQNLIVHINGWIDKLTPDRLKSEFKLTTSSYNTEDFIKSDWRGRFTNDLKRAKAIFYVGTSLDYDLDISRIINANPELKQRTFFIDKITPIDEIDVLDTKKKYGEVHYIGLDGFCDTIKDIKTGYLPCSSKVEFSSFDYIEAENFSHKSDSTQLYWDLLLHGSIDNDLAFSMIENNDYLFDRVSGDCINNYLECKEKSIIVVHSDLGNGKTSYLKRLAIGLCTKYDVFYFNSWNEGIYEEVMSIKNDYKNPIVIIENYYDHWNVIECIEKLVESHVSIILSGRTYIHENRLKELVSRLNVEESIIREIDLNVLKERDISNLVSLLDKIDTWEDKPVSNLKEKKKYIEKKLHSKLSNVLLDVIKSKGIKDKIDDIYTHINSNEDMKKILTAISINSILDLGMNAYEIVEYLDIKDFNHLARVNEHVRTLINWEENRIEFKSSVLAKYLMDTKVERRQINDVVKKMAIYANKNNYGELSELISRKLISASNLHLLSRNNSKQELEKTIEIFDELKEFELYKDRPFFWLQYAIACLDCKIFDRTLKCLDIAYAKAKKMVKNRYKSDSFDTFQVDTQKGRLALEMIAGSDSIENFIQGIKEARSLFAKSIRSKYQSASYVTKQFYLYEEIWVKHKSNLSVTDKRVLLEAVKEADDLLLISKIKNNHSMKRLTQDIISSVAE